MEIEGGNHQILERRGRLRAERESREIEDGTHRI